MQIGGDADQHIVLYQACGHYECVEYDGLREFPSGHEFVVRMSEFAARLYEYPTEDDPELEALQTREAAVTTAHIDVMSPAADNAQSAPTATGDAGLGGTAAVS